MTVEHLHPLLDHTRDSQLFFQAAELLARAQVPPSIKEAIRLGRLTALRKLDGGVRGIVAGDIVRRLVARTISQQLSERVQVATAPFQYALSTRAGCECVAHALQGITEMSATATITSVDGISAFDLISRKAMLEGLRGVDESVVPFVSMFYSSPSGYLWEDAEGTTHTIVQGEGGEQGDPMMPLLFSLGQHPALVEVQRQLLQGEHLFAFLDDIYIVTEPERVRTVLTLVENALLAWAGISIHQGKTKIWNQAGIQPPGCEMLERLARVVDQHAHVWRGPELPTHLQGLKILGTPLGHPDYVRAHMDRAVRDHQTLLDRIPLLQDVQAAWLLLLHCASARANYLVRVVEPASAREFCDIHDDRMWQCLEAILQTRFADVEEVRNFGSLPMVLGGIGLRSAARTSKPAYWASWGDSLAMIRRRHPVVADQLVHQLEGHPETPFLRAAADTRRELLGVMGFEPPSWQAMSHGARPPHREPEDVEPGTVRSGWQHEACSRVERRHRRELFSHTPAQVRALVRSQGGGGAGAVLSVAPTSRETTLSPHLFRVILLRRLRQALPLCARWCRCGRLLDSHGHHRAACAHAGMLSRRGTLLRVFWRESAEKPEDAFAPISWCVTWTCRLLMSMMEEGWRSSWTGCPCEEGPNWPSTRRWCVHCTVMALHDDKLPSVMGLH